MKAEASKLLAKWVDGTQYLEAFISFFDLSSDKIAEDALWTVLSERPELPNDRDLSIGEKCSGLASTTDTPTWCYRVPLGKNHPGKIAARPRLLAFHWLHQSSQPLGRLPGLTLLAFKVQLLFNTCLNWVQEHASGLPRIPGVENDEDDEDTWEEEIMDGVLVLSDVLKLGACLDFSDEMGWRGIAKLVS